MNTTAIFVGKHPTCGHVRAAACVDENDADDLAESASFARDWKKAGLIFERIIYVDGDTVHFGSCEHCDKLQRVAKTATLKQASLF